MEPAPLALEMTTTPEIATKSKTALLEAVEDITYGSVSDLQFRGDCLIKS